jgi:hypothetical protein
MSRVAAYRSYAAKCLALAEKTTLESETPIPDRNGRELA